MAVDIKIVTKALEQLSARAKASNAATFGTERIFTQTVATIAVVEAGEIGLSPYTKKGGSEPTSFKLTLPNGSVFYATAANNIDLSSVQVGDEFQIWENVSPKMIKAVDANGVEIMNGNYNVYEQEKDSNNKGVTTLSLRIVSANDTYSPTLFVKP